MTPLPKEIFDHIKFIKTCPLCKTAYDKQGIRLVMGEESAHWLHITCPRCSSALMAVVVTSPHGMSSVGMLTDFNYDDAIRFRDEGAISADDCLTLHQFLYDLSTHREPANRKVSARARRR
ncbi:MAG: hypothetical protein AAB579_00785 [Patescibacteria group bacterium]